ncbi:MAG: hypothetical protein IKE76_02995 [Clostridia bacterium]|nr:hypothetical protein [Clostridia bacterium]
MGLFKKKKQEQQRPFTLPTDHELHKEDFRVSGTYYHEAAFKRLQKANPAWRDSAKKCLEEGKVGVEIYHYDYIDRPIDLLRDRLSEYEPWQVKVQIAGQHVGYLSPEDSVHVFEILQFASVKYITAKVWGGEWKAVMQNGEVFKGTAVMRVSIRIAYSV